MTWISDYKVNSSGVCDRTRTAAYIKQLGHQQWCDHVHVLDQVKDSDEISNILRGWVAAYLEESKLNIESLEEMYMEQASVSPVEERRSGVLLRRWYQIKSLCEYALKASFL